MPDDNMTIRERYLEQMVESASPEGLLMMLVEGASNFIRRAQIELERERLEEVHNCLVKAQNIYMELVITLDLDSGEFAENLALVYQFLYNLLIEANLDKDPTKIESALRLSEEIRELWKDAVNKSRPVQGEIPAQTIAAQAPVVKPPSNSLYEPVGVLTTAKTQCETSDAPLQLNITG